MKRPTLVAAASVAVLLWAAGPAIAQDAASIRIGGSVRGALTADDAKVTGEDGDYVYDDYRFQARNGQRLEATLRSDAFDAYLALYAEGDDTPVAEDDDGLNDGTNARLRYTVGTGGVYVLRARTLSGTDGGAYDLSLTERPPAPRGPRPTGIRLGQTLQGDLNARDPEDDDGHRYDAYVFRATQGQRFVITQNSDDFDSVVQVGRMTGGDFVKLAENDDGADTGLNSRLIFAAPATGDYIIRATGFSDGQGRYSLGLAEAPPAPAAKPITLGEKVEGALSTTSPTDDDGHRAEFYRFRGTDGQRISIELKASGFDTYLTLRRASDNSVVAENDEGGDGTNSRLTHTLPADDDYVIEARAFSGDGEGRFTLVVTETAPPPPPTPVALGQTIEGEITEDAPREDDGKRYVDYVVSGKEGQRIQVILRSGDFDSFLQIGSASGDFSADVSDDDGLGEGTDARITYTLPADGDYIVRVTPYAADGKGLYSLELSDRGPEPKPGSLLVGATVRGELSDKDAMTDEGAYFDAYRFQAKKDEKLRITMVSNAFDAFIDLGSDGDTFESLATDDDGLSDKHARLDWTAPDDGWYVIRARAYAPNQTGPYALTVERQPAGAARDAQAASPARQP